MKVTVKGKDGNTKTYDSVQEYKSTWCSGWNGNGQTLDFWDGVETVMYHFYEGSKP